MRNVCLLLLVAAPLPAQFVGGRLVEHESGRGVGAAMVRLSDSLLKTLDSARTDTTGAFMLTAPGAGTFFLRIVAQGYLPVRGILITLKADEFNQQNYALQINEDDPPRFGEPEILPMVLPGVPRVEYPSTLRAAKIEGEVLMQFVVDATGKAVDSTITSRDMKHPEFVEAAKRVILGTTFSPARKDGKAVAWPTAWPFDFRLAVDSSAANANAFRARLDSLRNAAKPRPT